MADPTNDPLDVGTANVLDAMVELMKTATRPDVMEAQRILLQRLAVQGDVFPSRIPAPLNITQVGGYLNLLETLGQQELRSQAVASALGIAGPMPGAIGLPGVVPVGFVDIANHRPAGPAQPSIPPALTVRADFSAALQTAQNTLAAAGCQLPLRAPRPMLPATQPGATPTALDMNAVLATLGRTLEVFPGTVLVDATVDPVALARLETPATDPLKLVARELDGGTLVTEASWVAKRASASSVVDDPAALARYLPVAPILELAGWHHPLPLAGPASLSNRGTLVRFVNVTGLVAGETLLGAELELLYSPAAIARSALAAFTAFVWDGAAFVAPA